MRSSACPHSLPEDEAVVGPVRSRSVMSHLTLLVFCLGEGRDCTDILLRSHMLQGDEKEDRGQAVALNTSMQFLGLFKEEDTCS